LPEGNAIPCQHSGLSGVCERSGECGASGKVDAVGNDFHSVEFYLLVVRHELFGFRARARINLGIFPDCGCGAYTFVYFVVYCELDVEFKVLVTSFGLGLSPVVQEGFEANAFFDCTRIDGNLDLLGRVGVMPRIFGLEINQIL